MPITSYQVWKGAQMSEDIIILTSSNYFFIFKKVRLKHGISVEYNMMKTGYIKVYGLLVDVKNII